MPRYAKCRCPDCGARHHTPDSKRAWDRHCRECKHCLTPCADAFMLKHEVWALTGVPRNGGVLHLKCVELLLVRELTLEDFIDAKINDHIRWAFMRGADQRG